MDGSGIRSAVDSVVGVCSRWEAGNLLQKADGAMRLGGLDGGKKGILYGLGIAAKLFDFLIRDLTD
jgi:hypothetical protein